MEEKAIQDQWPEAFKTCWGCGDRNEHGLRIKSYWDGDESVCEWRAEPHHIAFPGYLNGGIIATIIDCHSVNTANAAVYRDEGREPGTEPLVFYVTGSIYVEYLRPTPRHHPVTRWVRPEEFVDLAQVATVMGFAGVMSGPLVRSSYRAGRLWARSMVAKGRDIPEHLTHLADANLGFAQAV